jgi:predicted metal-dependent peptidase
MTVPSETPTPEAIALAKAQRGLKLVSANLPHLAGLAHSVRLRATPRYPVAAISATGLLLVNPTVFSTVPMSDVVFVLAHELLHLALDSFGRGGQSSALLVNVAHDFIINDILSHELGRPVPLNGLQRENARTESLEAIITELAQHQSGGQACWSVRPKKRPRSRNTGVKSKMQEELEKAGLLPPEPEETPDPFTEGNEDADGDMISAEEEQKLEPELKPAERQRLRDKVRREAAKAVSLQELRKQASQATQQLGSSDHSDPSQTTMDAIATAYAPPWQLALQHWLDAVSPGPRTYARPSRRGGDRSEIVLPGRKREGWTLHIVLDTSGSMLNTLPHILGLLAAFCEASNVTDIHILQCDVGVTADEWIDPSQLRQYRITGFGGSDMSPAMQELDQDDEVNAVLVLTDGYIDFPHEEPHYSVLWGLVSGTPYFEPPYGTVIHVDA